MRPLATSVNNESKTEREREERVTHEVDSFIVTPKIQGLLQAMNYIGLQFEFYFDQKQIFSQATPATAFLAERPNGWLLMYR